MSGYTTKATGKARCVECGKIIPKETCCWQQLVNSRASPYFCSKCLGRIARLTNQETKLHYYPIHEIDGVLFATESEGLEDPNTKPLLLGPGLISNARAWLNHVVGTPITQLQLAAESYCQALASHLSIPVDYIELAVTHGRAEFIVELPTNDDKRQVLDTLTGLCDGQNDELGRSLRRAIDWINNH
jgi:hypothetical protein